MIVDDDPAVDIALARRLERAEGEANAAFVEARAAWQPESVACWISAGGAYCMFDGPQSPISQSFGLGLFDEVGERDLQRIEQFFAVRQTPTNHEICPLAGPGMGAMLADRGYVPIEHSGMMYRPVGRGTPEPLRPTNVTTRVIDQDEAERWVEVSALGWSEYPEAATFMREVGRLVANRKGSIALYAERDGRPIATGALFLSAGVAMFAGASTIPSERGRGAQSALLQARLELAHDAGCDLAVMVTEPGSASQRNAQRAGFRIAYTRTKWRKDLRPGRESRSIRGPYRSSRSG